MQSGSLAYVLSFSFILAMSGSLSAQEQRVTLPNAKTRPVSDAPPPPVIPRGAIIDKPVQLSGLIPPRARELPAPITVLPGDIDPPRGNLGDEPDFCRTEDVLDKNGNVVAIRRIGNPYTLSFMNGDYAPQPGIDPDLRRTLLASPQGFTYGFIMFRGRMSAEKVATIHNLGVELFDVMTYQSMQAKIPSHALAALANLPFVHWVGYARTHQKIDHNFAPLLEVAKSSDALNVIINPFEADLCKDSLIMVKGQRKTHDEWINVDGEGMSSDFIIPNGRFHKLLVNKFGFEFKHYNEIIHNFEGRMTKAQILRLLQEDWVHSVEIDPGIPTVGHDQAMPMAGQDWVRASFGGKGVACGYADDGIDSTPWHDDFSGKSYVYFGNAITPLSSHGTHTAGTIWGNGSGNGRYKGAAPTVATGGATNRVFYHRFDTAFSTICSDFGKDYTDSNSKVSPYPRVSSHSWGWSSSAGFSGTESNARTADTASYNKKQLWVFCSGNTKSTPNMWLWSPASGKNILAVGSVIDKFNSARTVNPEQKSGFSRWGVTDSRTKPDLVACGDSVTSTKWNTTSDYSNKSGCSMSTPLVSGVLISKVDASSFFNDKPEALRALAVASTENEGRLSGGLFLEPETGKGNRSSTGWGMINSPAMVWNLTESTHKTVGNLVFTASGQGWNSSAADFDVPSDAIYVRVVVATTEPAVAATATKARINDVRGYLDWAPFTAGNNTGEVTVSSGMQTVIVRNWAAVPAASKGNKVRVKVYAQSIIPTSKARASIVVFWYKRHPSTNPTVTASGDSYVQPSASYTLTGAMKSSNDQFRGGRLWYDGSFSSVSLKRQTKDLYNQWYYSANSHTSNPYPKVGKGGGTGIVVGAGTNRPVDFNLTAPASEGTYTLYVRGTYATTTSPAPQLEATQSVCVDGTPPPAPKGLKSTSHTPSVWSNNRNIAFSWTPSADTGCAGLAKQLYGTAQSSCPSTIATSIGAATSTQTLTNRAETTSLTGHYFAVRGQDNAVNTGSSTCVGPYLIDIGKPTVTLVRINSGATYTNSLSVQVQSTGTDSRSGVSQMRHSSNGSTWSPWVAYSSSAKTWSLSSYGGNTAQGTKRVYCQLRDRAGNISISKSDTIIYDSQPPVVTSCRLNGFASYTSSLTATLTITSTGSPTLMRYGCNGTNWSPFTTIAASSSVNLSLYGGNSSPGTKTVYVQARDAAGNTSSNCTARIVYLTTPNITGGTTTTLTNVTRGYYRLTGSGFYGANRVDFGSTAITSSWTSANDDWWGTGAFRVISDSVIYVYPPQGKATGKYDVRVRNPLLSGNVFNVFVTFETSRRLYSNSLLTAGKTLTINVARSNSEPSTTACIICFSPLGSPSVAPGIISLEIGAGFSALFQFPMLGFSGTTRALTVTAPTSTSHKGLTIYFEAVYIRDPLPVPTSNAWKCTLK